MVKSMTGFGRAEFQNEKRKLTAEIKSVNNRYLDFNIRMPKKYSLFEAAIRSTLKEYMQRGKVDVYISSEDFSEGTNSLVCNTALAGEYLSYCRKLGETFNLENDVRVSDLTRFPEVFVLNEAEENEEEIWTVLEKVLREAAERFDEARLLEGKRLESDLLEKLDDMKAKVTLIEEHEPEILSEYRNKLEEKVREILVDKEIDEDRIAAEVVIYADKICTDEETVRLKSHIDQMKKELENGSGVGRKLDFLTQEMNREANTSLSKAGDLITSDIGIELKTEIEKIREQIQNIE